MNDRKTGKWIISISLCILISGCTWNPPEGYTEKHHSYEELVEYARSIDPDATVSDDSESMRFQVNDVIVSGIEVDSITQDELDELWDAYKRINSELEQYDLRKTFWLKIAFPDGDSYFKETSEQYYQDKIGRLKENGKL
jgi:hypothetical protein